MARNASSSNSNYFRDSNVTQLGTGTIAGWINPDSLPGATERYYAAHYVESPGNSTEDKSFLFNSSGNAKFYIYDGAAKLTGASGNALSAGTWGHLAAVIDGTTLSCWVDGGTPGTVSAGSSYTGFSSPEFIISQQSGSAHDGESTRTAAPGDYAEWGIWDVALDQAEIDALASGVSPLLVRPASLIHHYRIIGNGSFDIDLMSTNTLTRAGTTAKAAHSRVIYPSAQIIQFPPVDAGIVTTPITLSPSGVGTATLSIAVIYARALSYTAVGSSSIQKTIGKGAFSITALGSSALQKTTGKTFTHSGTGTVTSVSEALVTSQSASMTGTGTSSTLGTTFIAGVAAAISFIRRIATKIGIGL